MGTFISSCFAMTRMGVFFGTEKQTISGSRSEKWLGQMRTLPSGMFSAWILRNGNRSMNSGFTKL